MNPPTAETLAAILAGCGLAGAPAVRFADGSVPVYAVGPDHVLKLFPTEDLAGFTTEARVLGALAGRLPVPTPTLEASGELDGWRWLLMSRLRGEGLAIVWPRLGADDRLRLAAQLGSALALLHRLPAPDLDFPPRGFRAFLAEQRAGCLAQQERRGLDAAWRARIPPFLDSVALDGGRDDCLLHTEVAREHLLVAPGARGWELSGLVDFEPAMRGAPEYELASVGIFFSCGDPGLLAAVLRAYGHPRDAELPRRALAYTLLHRYSNLRWYLERMPPAPGTESLDALAGQWWAVR